MRGMRPVPSVLAGSHPRYIASRARATLIKTSFFFFFKTSTYLRRHTDKTDRTHVLTALTESHCQNLRNLHTSAWGVTYKTSGTRFGLTA